MTDKTHTVMNMVRNSRQQKQLKMEAEMNTMFFSEGAQTENTRLKFQGKFSLPNAVHLDILSPEGAFSLYANEDCCYVLADGEVDHLEKEEQEKLMATLQLDQMTKNNFERLMIYAEEMDITTEGDMTTISLPVDALNSEFVREFEQEMQEKESDIVLKNMKYVVKVDNSYNLLSFYMFKEIGLKGASENAFKLCTEAHANYLPVDPDEDFSIPQHIIEAAK